MSKMNRDELYLILNLTSEVTSNVRKPLQISSVRKKNECVEKIVPYRRF